jgi:guanine nucleotide-binding protein G(i) subunit alpha
MLTVASFFKEFKRMTSPGYSPTEADILEVLKYVEPPKELHYGTRAYDYHFLDFSSQQSGTTGWYTTSSSLSLIIYCVNLAEYDNTGPTMEKNGLVASLDFFEASMETGVWVKPVILLLTHMSEFRHKLATSPLERHFPDYSDGNDVEPAANYILDKFLAVQRSSPIFARTFDLTTTRDVWKIYDAHREATQTTWWEGLLRGLAY